MTILEDFLELGVPSQNYRCLGSFWKDSIPCFSSKTRFALNFEGGDKGLAFLMKTIFQDDSTSVWGLVIGLMCKRNRLRVAGVV